MMDANPKAPSSLDSALRHWCSLTGPGRSFRENCLPGALTLLLRDVQPFFRHASDQSRRPQEACPDHRAGPPWPRRDLSGAQGLADQRWGSGGRYGLRAWLAPSGFHGRFKDQNRTPIDTHIHSFSYWNRKQAPRMHLPSTTDTHLCGLGNAHIHTGSPPS